MSKAHALIALAALIILLGVVGSMEMEDAKMIEAMRQKFTEIAK